MSLEYQCTCGACEGCLDAIRRHEESVIRATFADATASKVASSRPHWYHEHCRVCMSCGREECYRERVYGEKPEDWYERHTLDEYLCECML